MAHKSDNSGFTLIEILVAIVLVGILAAVAVLGMGRLTDSAPATGCNASADAARTAATTYLTTTNNYPVTFGEMTQAGVTGGPSLVAPAGATITDTSMTAGGWRLTMTPATPPTFTCSIAPAVVTSVVDAAHPGAWSFVMDNPGSTGGGGQFVPGPATAPVGSGSAQLSVASTVDGWMLSNSAFGSTRLDKLTVFAYSSYQVSGSRAPALQFDVKYRTADTAYGGRLVFEPYLNGGTVVAGWQTWSALEGQWWASYSKTDGTQPFGSLGLCKQSSTCTWAQVMQNWPDATIGGTGRISFKVGSGWTASSYAVDKFTMGLADVSGNVTETTYDFGG